MRRSTTSAPPSAFSRPREQNSRYCRGKNLVAVAKYGGGEEPEAVLNLCRPAVASRCRLCCQPLADVAEVAGDHPPAEVPDEALLPVIGTATQPIIPA